MAPHFQFLEQPLRFGAEVVLTNRAGSHGPYALVTHERSAERQRGYDPPGRSSPSHHADYRTPLTGSMATAPIMAKIPAAA